MESLVGMSMSTKVLINEYSTNAWSFGHADHQLKISKLDTHYEVDKSRKFNILLIFHNKSM